MSVRASRTPVSGIPPLIRTHLECGILASQLREASSRYEWATEVLPVTYRMVPALPFLSRTFSRGNVMPRRLLLIAGVVVSLASTLRSPAKAQSPVDFTLREQYDTSFTLSTQRGRMVLLLYSDRKGSQFVGYFSRAARKWRVERGDTAVLRIVNIANLDGVPRLIRGSVKGNFKGTENGRPKSSVLLDFDGKLAKLFPSKKDATSAWIISPDGVLLWSGGGTNVPSEHEALVAALTAAADAHARPSSPNDSSESPTASESRRR